MTAIITEDSISVLQGFKALSDPHRLEIIHCLRTQELCVCELCETLNLKQSKLSFHLKILKESRLVFSRQKGRWVYYRLNLSQLLALETYLASFRDNGEILPAKLCEDFQ